MAEEIRSPDAVLVAAQVKDPRPVAFIDVDLGPCLVPRERQAALAVRLKRRNGNERLTDKCRYRLVEAVEIDSFERISTREWALLVKIGQAQGMVAQCFGIIQEFVDDREGCEHRHRVSRTVAMFPSASTTCR